MDVVKVSFKHKWLRKQFDTRANEMIYLFGRDIVFMAIRHYCHIKLEEREQRRREEDAASAFENHEP